MTYARIFVVLALADCWESLGYVTEGLRDERGYVKGRRITDTLALVAESGPSISQEISWPSPRV